MTRRERLENKIQRRLDWAESATRRADAASNRSHDLVKNIPMGQPILVGHHSEKGHRRVLNQSWDALGRSVMETRKAEAHESKAANLEAALKRTIFSDDDNSIEALEARIEKNELKREEMKKVNALYKKADVAGLANLGVNYAELQAKLAALGGYFGKAPNMPFELSNLGQRIAADRKRIEAVKAQQARAAEASATENGMKIKRWDCNEYCTVVFAEKPDYSIIRALKDAGFRWGGGSWFGQVAKLPASVLALEAE
jgi:hypothetical protein